MRKTCWPHRTATCALLTATPTNFRTLPAFFIVMLAFHCGRHRSCRGRVLVDWCEPKTTTALGWLCLCFSYCSWGGIRLRVSPTARSSLKSRRQSASSFLRSPRKLVRSEFALRLTLFHLPSYQTTSFGFLSVLSCVDPKKILLALLDASGFRHWISFPRIFAVAHATRVTNTPRTWPNARGI